MLASKDARGDEPTERSERIDEPHPLDIEPGLLQQLREVTLAVATLVLDGPVDRAVQEGVRGNEQEQCSARREQVVEPGQRAAVVPNVLEDVEADDGVERPGDVLDRPPDDGHVLAPLEPPAQDREHLWIGLDRDDLTPARGEVGEGSDSRPRVENAPAEIGAAPLEQPGVVGARALHAAERLALGISHARGSGARARAVRGGAARPLAPFR